MKIKANNGSVHLLRPDPIFKLLLNGRPAMPIIGPLKVSGYSPYAKCICSFKFSYLHMLDGYFLVVCFFRNSVLYLEYREEI